ncbi:protein of unknown function DUF990 [Paenibacillus curdlanolyticus YK9]|uniref:ABC transporter permease protein n=1 Tax=Paenibacillus curdlanolyticus YK9 TaxID=717606 RepID=E0I891_9BACL|nr:ABC-2 family transporter protein [Paenibacillus curdlanolyticus]EFM11396.1 protein of unknown function DUF990 [Paenibacillus curdlanolyticus YK9]
MAWYFQLYIKFAKQHLKVMMEYRADFMIGVLANLFTQGTAIIFINILFKHVNSIHGWGYYEVLFIYGVALSGKALENIFFDNLWNIGWRYIKPGDFDRILLRPVSPLFHIVADRLHKDGFGSLIVSSIVLLTAMNHLQLEWSGMNVFILILFIISSGLIYAAVNLFFGSLSFWMVDSLPIMEAVNNLSEFVRYPMTIYKKGIQFVLTFVIPYGFTAFYPAAYFIEQSGFSYYSYLTPLVAVACCLIAYSFWHKGLRAFTSTGS